MKIRNGFVSNSSSSSFIVAFPHEPKSSDDVMAMLFPGFTEGRTITYYDYGMTVRDISDTIFRDIQNQSRDDKADKYKLVELFVKMIHSDSYYSRYVHSSEETRYPECRLVKQKIDELEEDERNKRHLIWQKHNIKEYNQLQKCPAALRELSAMPKHEEEIRNLHDKVDAMILEIAQKEADEFIQKHKEAKIYQLEYGDESGQAVMEWGGIFDNIPHITISNH